MIFAKNYWRFEDPELNIHIARISNQFDGNTIKKTGDVKAGSIIMDSYHSFDDIWGPFANVEISWETIEPYTYHHGMQVKESIDLYASINVNASKKENEWLQSHEMTIWYGKQQKLKQRRMYFTQIIHAVFYCDRTTRVFDVHFKIVRQGYADFQSLALEIIRSFQCHEI